MDSIKVENIYEIIKDSPIRKKLKSEDDLYFNTKLREKTIEIENNIKNLIEIKNKPLKIVVVGEVKSGKSTFINALLHKNISEMDVLESTSSIIEIIYSKHEEVIQKDNIKRIYTNTEDLKNMYIVDTPGIKSINQNNESKTLEYIQKTDLIIFFIDGTHLGQEDILKELDLISMYKKPLFIVINKADLIEDSEKEIMDYAYNEYGLYTEDIFYISSYREYQENIDFKNNIDDNIYGYNKLRENFIKLRYYIKEIYFNEDRIKEKSIGTSLEAIIKKDIKLNEEYLKSMYIIREEIKRYKNLLLDKEEYINTRMEHEIKKWIKMIFFRKELQEIKEDLNNIERYIRKEYIDSIVNEKKEVLDKLFYGEWTNAILEMDCQKDENILEINDDLYKNSIKQIPTFDIDIEEDIKLDDIITTISQGAMIGAASGGIASIYAAGFGSSAASVTIGSAIMTYCPPFLLVGTLASAMGKIAYTKVKTQNQSKELIKDVELFIQNLKYSILEEFNKSYITCSQNIVNTVKIDFMKNMKIKVDDIDLEVFCIDIEKYIEKLNTISIQ